MFVDSVGWCKFPFRLLYTHGDPLYRNAKYEVASKRYRMKHWQILKSFDFTSSTMELTYSLLPSASSLPSILSSTLYGRLVLLPSLAWSIDCMIRRIRYIYICNYQQVHQPFILLMNHGTQFSPKGLPDWNSGPQETNNKTNNALQSTVYCV